MAGALKGGQVKSIKSLKSSLKRGGGSEYLTRVNEDGLTIRFITEPDEWVEFFEHYDDVRKFFPCTDDCDGCRDGSKPSKRYLTNAVDTSEGKVVPLMLAKSAASQVMKKYDRFKTIMDRDYIIVREGTGFDTEYDVTPEAPSRMSITKYTPLDLWAILKALVPGADKEDEDEDEDEETETPARRARARGARSARPVRKKVATRRRPVADEDDNPWGQQTSEDEDDEDEEVRPAKRINSTKKKVMSRPVKKPVRRMTHK